MRHCSTVRSILILHYERCRESEKLLLRGSLSPLPMHKALVLFESLRERQNDQYFDHECLALAEALVFSSSNLHFGPEVGVGKPKPAAPVIAPWLACIHSMADDLRDVRPLRETPAAIYHADARHILQILEPDSVDAVITSPPYPNEKDYSRTTRLESVMLGFIQTGHDLQALKRGLLRSNTRNVYKGDDDESG